MPSAISGWSGSPWRRSVAIPLGRNSEVVTPISGRIGGLSAGPIYPRSAMSSQYIFTMYKLSRTHPPDKQVLKDISLSFMPGAKIGVLGLNGSGKSTLLRIMAGKDQEFRGE